MNNGTSSKKLLHILSQLSIIGSGMPHVGSVNRQFEYMKM